MQSTDTCSVPECGKPVRSRGWCYGHYMKVHRYGTPSPALEREYVDLRGQRRGTLTIIERVPPSAWRCRCDCGRDAVITTGTLNRGQATCGRFGKHHRGEHASYNAVHMRLRADRGRASDHRCVDCGRVAAHWSFSNDASADERRDPETDLAYSLNPDDYSPRCVSCHAKHDGIEPTLEARLKGAHARRA